MDALARRLYLLQTIAKELGGTKFDCSEANTKLTMETITMEKAIKMVMESVSKKSD